MKRKNIGLTAILAFTALLSLTAQPALSQSPSLAMKIMKNIEITGLTNGGEETVVKYSGKGSWTGGIEAWYFTVWRQKSPGWDKDMQANIELAKIAEGVYRMEIYHSWTTLRVDMPYEYTVWLEEPHLLILIVTVNL